MTDEEKLEKINHLEDLRETIVSTRKFYKNNIPSNIQDYITELTAAIKFVENELYLAGVDTSKPQIKRKKK